MSSAAMTVVALAPADVSVSHGIQTASKGIGGFPLASRHRRTLIWLAASACLAGPFVGEAQAQSTVGWSQTTIDWRYKVAGVGGPVPQQEFKSKEDAVAAFSAWYCGQILAGGWSTCSYGTATFQLYYDQRQSQTWNVSEPFAWSNPGNAHSTTMGYQVNGKGYSITDVFHDKPQQCPANAAFGNPVFPLTGSKRAAVTLDEIGLAGLQITAGYDTKPQIATNVPALHYPFMVAPSFGALWNSSVHKMLQFEVDQYGLAAVQASRGTDGWVSFAIQRSTGLFLPDVDVYDRLSQVSGGWLYVDQRNRAIEKYDANGNILATYYANGSSVSYTYSTSISTGAPAVGLIVGVQDIFGRSVALAYATGAQQTTPALASLTATDGRQTSFSYATSGMLASVQWPDGTSRNFLYETTALPWALTGIVDEGNKRIATYGYTNEGIANSTAGALGTNAYAFSYASLPQWVITETRDEVALEIRRDHNWAAGGNVVVTLPSGGTSTLSSVNVLGAPRVSSQSQPAGAGCLASTSSQAFDANANVIQRDDFNGNRACYGYDLSRNVETARIEGLANTASCSSVLASSSLPAGSRKTSTQWHSDWRIATKFAEPRRLTTSVYNGQPDPFNGGATASCAPSAATLPDGKPIVVLCKQVEQATTDVDGSAGLSASLDATVPARVQQWTYNQYGQVLAATDALNHTTSYSYYGDTTTAHTLGDLATVTNALNQVVASYTQYNPAGQWLQMVDANGTTTTRTFDLRLRLKSSSTAGATTSYDYWPNGLLKTVTLPDASTVSYGYDDAQRLTSVTDNLGNSISYTLDNMGNHTAENVKDPSGTLSRTLTQNFDALGRVQQTVGR